MSLTETLRQTWPGKPTYTEKDVPDLTGKVMIVTGSNTGIGKETARILYSRNAKVYMLARSEAKVLTAMESIRAAHPTSKGELVYIHLDLADLPTIRVCADEFLRRESQLHVLFNNAGVMRPPQGSRSAQGYELQLGVNCLGTWALTNLLAPLLAATAKTTTAPAGSVRVVWVSSSAIASANPRNFVEQGVKKITTKTPMQAYGTTKMGNYLHAAEFARRHRADGVVSVSLNPGNLHTDLQRHMEGTLTKWVIERTILYPTVYGSYTCLFAGLSPDVTLEKTGSYLAPWGRFSGITKAMGAALKTKAEGGTGDALQWWEWTEAEVNKHP